MNPAKSEIKILTTREIGADVEDKYEAAEKQVSEFKGAEEGLKQSARALASLHAHIDKDLDEGVVDKVLNEPLKVAEYAKKYVTRCMGLIENMGTRAEFNKYRAQGKAEGLKTAVDTLKKVHDAEAQKLQRYVEALEAAKAAEENGEEVELPGRPVQAKREPSGRPVDGLAERRAAGKAAKKEKEPKAGYTKKTTRKVKDGEDT